MLDIRIVIHPIHIMLIKNLYDGIFNSTFKGGFKYKAARKMYFL